MDQEFKWPECTITIDGKLRRYVEFEVDPAYVIKRVTPSADFGKVTIILDPRPVETEKIQ